MIQAKTNSDGVAMYCPANRKSWRNWLAKNHADAKSVWLVYKRNKMGLRNLSYADAVEEALCFGWIDSKSVRLDEIRTIQYFTKRKPKSNWSRLNKERIEQLTKRKQMYPAGEEAVALAKKTGTWTALDDIENLVIPADLEKLLRSNNSARRHFNAFPKSVKRGILEWIQSARRPETRAKRLEETVRLASDNIRANQYKKRQDES